MCAYVLKGIFLGEQFWNVYLEEHLRSKMYFLREQFWRVLMFWKTFFDGAIYFEFMVVD